VVDELIGHTGDVLAGTPATVGRHCIKSQSRGGKEHLSGEAFATPAGLSDGKAAPRIVAESDEDCQDRELVTPSSGGLMRTALRELGEGYRAAGHEVVLIGPGEARQAMSTPRTPSNHRARYQGAVGPAATG